MGLAFRPRARMTGMQVRFVDDVELGRRQRLVELASDGFGDGHEMILSFR